MRIGTDRLTQIDSGQPFSIEETHKGQAHFAIPSSPFTCGGCRHHRPAERGVARYCFKASTLIGRRMQAVPGSAKACRYFEAKT